MTGSVAVPEVPPGCEIAPAGVIPGELVRWRLACTGGTVTLILGVTRLDPAAGHMWGWVQLHAGPGTGGSGTLNADGLALLAGALEAAHRFVSQDFAAHTTAGQTTLWENQP